MKRSGMADLPLHGGRVPQWLATRMTQLGTGITEAIVRDYGTSGFQRKVLAATARRAVIEIDKLESFVLVIHD